MRYISRSSHETYCKCPRRHYYQYRYKGTGYEEARTPLPLAIGIAAHAGLEVLLRDLDLDGSVRAVHAAWGQETAGWRHGEIDSLEPWERDSLREQLGEGAYVAEALVRGFGLYRLDGFLSRYEILQVEKEVSIELSPNVTLQARGDVVAQERDTGSIVVGNHKTMGRRDNFSTQFLHDVQMWTEAFAIQEDLGKEVLGCVILGFYKGQNRDGAHVSPLLYGYRTDDGLFSPTWMRSSKSSAWRRFKAWEEPTPAGVGLHSWLQWVGERTIGGHFMESPPIVKNDEVVRGWIKQVVAKETAIEEAMGADVSEEARLRFFWQNFSSMNCRWCPFNPVCFGKTTIETLIEDGYLKERHDHHAPAAEEDP